MTIKSTPADVAVQPRNIRFGVEAGRGRHWLGGDPVATAVGNALSLTFPDGERLFVDAVRHYRGGISGKLAEDVRGFIAQESIHSREHHELNQLIDRDHYKVEDLEAMILKNIEMARSRGPMAMLLSTIALEHFTAMMAEMHMLQRDFFAASVPEIDRLWRWHAMEETEHKAVAFDVFLHAAKTWPAPWRYFRRVHAMLLTTLIFTRTIHKMAALLLERDGYAPKAARRAVSDYLWRKPGLFSKGWRTYFAWYRPGFHPWDQTDNAPVLAAWKAEFDAAAISKAA